MDMEGSLKDSSIHGEGTLSVSGGSVHFTVIHGGLNVTLSYKPHWNCTGIQMHTMVTPTQAFDPTFSIYFARSVVPDMGQPWDEDFGTTQIVESPMKGQDGNYAVVTSKTKEGRAMSLLSCDPRAHAGIGGFGFMYDLPTFIGMTQAPEWLHMTAYDSDQDIWIIWKDDMPAVGEPFEFDSHYFTRNVPRDERDRTFCAVPGAPLPGSQAPGANESEPGSEPLPSEEPTTTTTTPAPESSPVSSPPSSPPKPSASGDPHLVNIRGERFDIYKLGQVEFLRVPYQSSKQEANFTAQAFIQDVAGSTSRCKESRYITSMIFGGAWLGNHNLEVLMDRGHMKVLFGGVQMKPSLQPIPMGGMVQVHMRDETQLLVKIGAAKIVVSRDIQPVHFFLNVQATSLGKLGYRIGGLLGEDDNADVSTPPAECRNVFLLKTPGKTLRSLASASA